VDNRAFTAPGELVSANGSNFHVRRFGEGGPLMLLECGLTMMSSCWGWLAPELGSFARVITYDRAGLGWSDERGGVRDARAIAQELSGLVAALHPQKPIILVGHSMGAMCNRAFIRLNPGRVSALVWLDPAHPDQINHRGIRRRMRNLLFYIEAAQLLATCGVPAIELPLTKYLDALPPVDFRALRSFLRNPRHLRATARETRAWNTSGDFLRGQTLNDIPLLMLSAKKTALPGWERLQLELATLSSRTTHLTFSEMSHISMLANRENAIKVAAEIRGFVSAPSL
jgi:pimeloyl-ACP methyl ester carboxylesterase